MKSLVCELLKFQAPSFPISHLSASTHYPLPRQTISWNPAHAGQELMLLFYCILPTAHRFLPTAYCQLHTAYCILLTALCPPSSVLCPLHTAYCLLSSVPYLHSPTRIKGAQKNGWLCFLPFIIFNFA